MRLEHCFQSEDFTEVKSSLVVGCFASLGFQLVLYICLWDYQLWYRSGIGVWLYRHGSTEGMTLHGVQDVGLASGGVRGFCQWYGVLHMIVINILSPLTFVVVEEGGKYLENL